MNSAVGAPQEITHRLGTEADIERIMELVRTSLGDGPIPRDPAYWAWKHHMNPFGASPVLLAEAGGEIVGLRVFMRWQWRSGAKLLHAVRAVDTATHPRWQGRGIFTRLTQALVQRMREEGVHFIFNTPNAKSRPGYLKMGWSAVGRTDIWIRPIRVSRVARILLGRNRDDEKVVVPADLPGSASNLDALCDDPRLPSLLEYTDRMRRLTTSLTPEYLRWRYRWIPGFTYRTSYELDRNGSAAAIYRFRKQRGLTELRICQLLVGSGRQSMRTAISVVRRLAKENGADYVSAMAAPETPERKVLIRAGFLPLPRFGPILTVRALTGPSSDVDVVARHNWRLSIGDLELF